MGMMKYYVMKLEEQVWDEVFPNHLFSNVIAESDSLAEALEKGMNVAKFHKLDIYLGEQYVTDTIHEMWNEFWSAQE